MTYRKLFLGILTASTLGLVAVCGLSFQNCYHVAGQQGMGSVAFLFEGTLFNSSLTLNVHKGGPARLIHFTVLSREDLPDPGIRPLGIFEFGKRPQDPPFESSPYLVHYLSIPVWIPFLILVGFAYAFTRILEKRSAARQEKSLAEKQAEDDFAKDAKAG